MRPYIVNLNPSNDKYPTIVKEEWRLGDVVKNFQDTSSDEGGNVTCYNDTCNCRPEYQRESIHKDNEKWCAKLIESALLGKPIGAIYIAKNNPGDSKYTYEVLDGQQRFLTLCRFASGVGNNGNPFGVWINENGSPKKRYFYQMPEDVRKRFLDYPLDIHICKGTPEQKVAWFITINEPGCELTRQEMRNAAFCGPFISAIKKVFSNSRNSVYLEKGSKYCVSTYKSKSDFLRQENLEFVLDCISYKDYADGVLFGDLSQYTKEQLLDVGSKDSRIKAYMSAHRYDENEAERAEKYYRSMVDWIIGTFFYGNNNYNQISKIQSLGNVEWARIYYEYSKCDHDAAEITKYLNQFLDTMDAGDFDSFNGVYEWLLQGMPKETNLMNPRPFSPKQKAAQIKIQGGIDPMTMEPLDLDTCHAHHIRSYRSFGKTDMDNCMVVNENTHRDIHDGKYSEQEQRERLAKLVDTIKSKR